MKLNIVLAEPQIPPNTGNIARTCAVTGAALHIIKPMGFTPDDKRLKRAGLDYWHYLDISYYENFGEFFSDKSRQCYFFTTKALNRYTDVSYPDNCFIVFGREDKGLPEELLYENKDRCVRIPMMPTLRSLNLSNSVAIAVYEILRQWDFPELQNSGSLTKFDWDSFVDKSY